MANSEYFKMFENLINRTHGINNTISYDLMRMVNKINDEPHRHYHTLEHVWNVFVRLRGIDDEQFFNTFFQWDQNSDLTNYALFFALAHDIVYVPGSSTNESDSIKWVNGNLIEYHHLWEQYTEAIFQNILDTVDIENTCETNTADRYSVLTSDINSLKTYFHNIWKEYQFVDLPVFKQKHLEIFNAIRKSHNYYDELSTKLYEEYVNSFNPSVGLYVGSFNPFHIGHRHIMEEAEKIFDKVVIAHGINSDKFAYTEYIPIVSHMPELYANFNYREVISYQGTLIDLYDHYKKMYSNVNIVRGIRNGNDLNSEMTMNRVIKDIRPDIPFVYIPCNKGHEHISSSTIRTMRLMGLSTSQYDT